MLFRSLGFLHFLDGLLNLVVVCLNFLDEFLSLVEGFLDLLTVRLDLRDEVADLGDRLLHRVCNISTISWASPIIRL